MGRTVKELKRSLTWREFRGWSVYYDAEPFGEERADLRIALLRKDVCTIMGGKAIERVPIEDFMACPDSAQPRPVMTDKQMEAAFLTGMMKHNAAIAGAKRPRFPESNGHRKP